MQVGPVECSCDGSSHVVLNVQEALMEMLHQWSLATERQGLFFTGNEAIMVVAVQAGKMTLVWCMAHLFNLVIWGTLQDTENNAYLI